MSDSSQRSFQKPARPVVFWGSGVFILLVFVVGAFWLWSRSGETAHPKRGSLVESVYGLGTVTAPKTYRLKSALHQSLQKVFVKEGDLVDEGQPLLSFDDSGMKRAPFKGTVVNLPFRQGEVVAPQADVVTLVSLESLYLELSLEQQHVLRVRPGQTAWVSFESLRGDRRQGRVHSVYPRDNQFLVRVDLDKMPEGVLPGMTADVAIEVARKQQVLMIPLHALSGPKVQVKRAGRWVKQSVKLGVVDGEWGELLPNDQGSFDLSESDELWVRQR